MLHLNLAPRRRPYATKDDIAVIAAMYASGKSAAEVARLLGRDRKATSDILKRRGLSRSRSATARLRDQRLPELRVNDAFFESWTPASAWVLGLIFGDGHIRHDLRTRAHQVYIVGTEQVTRAAAALLGHRRGPFTRPACPSLWELRWRSVRMVESLVAKFGLYGDKADRIYVPEMPDDMLPHFVRGLWDADGHWYARGNYRHAQYTSISKRLIEQLQSLVGGRVASKMPCVGSIRGVPVRHRRPAYELVLRRDETNALVRWLYEGTSPEIRCERKYAIARVALEPNMHSHSLKIPDPATRSARQKITKGEVNKAVALYTSGLSSNKIGALLQRDPRALREHLTRAKVIRHHRPPRPVTDADVAEMKRLYAEGLSSNEVAERLDRDGRVVRKYLTLAGVMRDHTDAALLWRGSLSVSQ